jgi:hypothetical protein
MRRSASFNPQARLELREAAAYYGLESEALRERFLLAVEEALEQVLAYPEAAGVVRGDIRRHLLRAFRTVCSTPSAAARSAFWR